MLTTGKSEVKTKIKVVRPFFYKGKTIEAGKVLEVMSGFAAEMVTANKASYNLDAKIVNGAVVDEPEKPKSK